MTTQARKLNRDVKLNKKKSALRMLRNPKANKSLIAHKIGITRATLYAWINQKNQEVVDLKPEAKIKLWERQALKDLQGSEIVRDLLINEVLSDPSTVPIATKNSIAASLSLSACQKWDKSRLEAGKSVVTIGLPELIQESSNRIRRLEAMLREDVVEVKEETSDSQQVQ